ncbi:MAG TPA: hypothetical protein VF215_02910, partial [Thermoanaerobaculia bacterium]
IDRMFAALLVVEYIAGIVGALLVSPFAWQGKERVLHMHVWVAVLGGAGIIILPILLAYLKPGAVLTRHVIAASQMLSSALLIHLTGGRIETHFHVFGSLAFLAFYLDWQVLVTATIVVAADHFLRGIYWPESVYGISNPEWWRFLEHAGWVVFEDVFLIWSCILGNREVAASAARQAEVEHLSEQEQLKSAALEMALAEMQATA